MNVKRCPTCGRKHKRSNPANQRYWLLLHRMAEVLKPQGQVYSAETWHVWCKQRWLGCDEVTMPNGKTLLIPKSSADLDTTEFAEYMTQVEVWAGEHGCWLEDMPE